MKRNIRQGLRSLPNHPEPVRPGGRIGISYTDNTGFTQYWFVTRCDGGWCVQHNASLNFSAQMGPHDTFEQALETLEDHIKRNRVELQYVCTDILSA